VRKIPFASRGPVRPAEVGLLAAAGVSRLKVHPIPRVALLSTGDELVELGEQPGPGQVVNSNFHLLAASAATFEPFVRPALRRRAGFREVLHPRLRVTLAAGVQGGERRQRFLWGTLEGRRGGVVLKAFKYLCFSPKKVV
jgi:molybdopterin biosynthesis enzyme